MHKSRLANIFVSFGCEWRKGISRRGSCYRRPFVIKEKTKHYRESMNHEFLKHAFPIMIQQRCSLFWRNRSYHKIAIYGGHIWQVHLEKIYQHTHFLTQYHLYSGLAAQWVSCCSNDPARLMWNCVYCHKCHISVFIKALHLDLYQFVQN